MFVCMFYLSPRSRIIVSVPGNIRNSKQNKAKQNRKKEGEKERSGEEQKFSLFVTNKMRMFFFCFFFLVLYFIQLNEKVCWLTFSFRQLLFLFCFFLFFVFGKSLTLGGFRKQRLEFDFCFLIAKKHVARRQPGSFISRGHVVLKVCVWFLSFFRLSRARKSVLSFWACADREMCFTQNIRSRITKRKTKK